MSYRSKRNRKLFLFIHFSFSNYFDSSLGQSTAITRQLKRSHQRLRTRKNTVNKKELQQKEAIDRHPRFVSMRRGRGSSDSRAGFSFFSFLFRFFFVGSGRTVRRQPPKGGPRPQSNNDCINSLSNISGYTKPT